MYLGTHIRFLGLPSLSMSRSRPLILLLLVDKDCLLSQSPIDGDRVGPPRAQHLAAQQTGRYRTYSHRVKLQLNCHGTYRYGTYLGYSTWAPPEGRGNEKFGEEKGVSD